MICFIKTPLPIYPLIINLPPRKTPINNPKPNKRDSLNTLYQAVIIDGIIIATHNTFTGRATVSLEFKKIKSKRFFAIKAVIAIILTISSR